MREIRWNWINTFQRIMILWCIVLMFQFMVETMKHLHLLRLIDLFTICLKENSHLSAGKRTFNRLWTLLNWKLPVQHDKTARMEAAQKRRIVRWCSVKMTCWGTRLADSTCQFFSRLHMYCRLGIWWCEGILPTCSIAWPKPSWRKMTELGAQHNYTAHTARLTLQMQVPHDIDWFLQNIDIACVSVQQMLCQCGIPSFDNWSLPQGDSRVSLRCQNVNVNCVQLHALNVL